LPKILWLIANNLKQQLAILVRVVISGDHDGLRGGSAVAAKWREAELVANVVTAVEWIVIGETVNHETIGRVVV
jgi:hypothetical protein